MKLTIEHSDSQFRYDIMQNLYRYFHLTSRPDLVGKKLSDVLEDWQLRNLALYTVGADWKSQVKQIGELKFIESLN
jgi:hypothetical protein